LALFDRQQKKARRATTAPTTWKPATDATAKAYEERSQELSAAQRAPKGMTQNPAREPVEETESVDAREAPEVQDLQETEGPEMKDIDQTLPSALEPELRKIFDDAVARVAEVELDAIRKSRELTQRSEEEGREDLKYALDGALQLVDALRVALEHAVEAVGKVHGTESELDQRRTRQPVDLPTAPAPVAEEPQPEPEPVAEPLPEPAAEPSTNRVSAESYTEPSPEMTEMFREQIQNMKSGGKSREEAERSLLRFNLGRRFLGLLDEVYAENSAEATQGSANGERKSRVRGFFTR
jgi:hypothetical protein